MTAYWRKGNTAWVFSIFAATIVFILSACQQGKDPKLERATTSWLVLESQGDARIENDDIFLNKELRPGDRLADNSRIVMSKSAYLIARGSGVQFAASGNTSVILPGNGSTTALTPLHGTMRIRLASAADDVKRITTPHLMASGTTAVVELSVDDEGTNIEVASGNITVSTPRGEHYVRLVAGASARLGDQTQNQLEIRPATEIPFQANEKLRPGTADIDILPSEQAIDSMTVMRPAANPARQSEASSETVILPANQLRAKAPGQGSGLEINGAEQLDEPLLSQANTKTLAPSNFSTGAGLKERQQQFDQLTDGLLNNLPTVNNGIYTNPTGF